MPGVGVDIRFFPLTPPGATVNFTPSSASPSAGRTIGSGQAEAASKEAIASGAIWEEEREGVHGRRTVASGAVPHVRALSRASCSLTVFRRQESLKVEISVHRAEAQWTEISTLSQNGYGGKLATFSVQRISPTHS